MPVPPQQHPAGMAEPSVWQKMKMGAMMGAGVGLTIGFIFGGWTIIRGGAGPRGPLPVLSQYMLSSAATFSFFLSIGSVIRNDELVPALHSSASSYHAQRQRMMLASPVIASRAEAAERIKARWAVERRRV